jgi:hypothetical protein
MDRVETGGIGGLPWSAAAPLLCAVHCLAAPLFVVFAPVLAGNHAVEAVLMGASAVVALLVVALGSRVHREPFVWLPVLAGLAIWVIALLSPGELQERALTTVGAVLLASGLYWDARLRHRKTCTSCRSGH